MVQRGNKGEVTFICAGLSAAKTAYLAGDFNGWDPTATRMTKSKDGTFRVRLVLPPGAHEYKFIVDGEWRNDPEAERQVMNSLGTLNSVVQLL